MNQFQKELKSSFLFLILLTLFGSGHLRAQAVINESAVTQTLYASPSGISSNDGLSTATPKNLNGAISAAANNASKIILLDGDYRQWVSLPAGNTLLIIEAQNSGQAAITGSDLATNWTDIGGGLFTLPWTQNWGLVNTGFAGNWSAYNRRTEMLFINGSRLLQRCTSDGNAVATNTLNAGEFTVNEGSDLITFRPPAGVTLSSSSRVEITTRGNSEHLFRSDGRSNLVLRGIVFRHHGGTINQRGTLRLEGASGSDPATQIRIEDCSFTQNNGFGMQLNNTADFSLTRVNGSFNGSRGAGGLGIKRGLIADSSFNSNNWRSGTANTGHDAAGFKMFDGQLNEFTSHATDGIVFLRCTFRDNNSVGFWQDYGGKNVTINSCLFENNEQGAIMQEMTPGPFTVTNSVIRNNGSWGIQSYGAPNIIITNNYIYGTRSSPSYISDPQYASLINVVLDDRQSTSLVGTDPSRPSSQYGHFKGWVITGNVIQATNPAGAPIFYATDYGSSANPNFPAKSSLLINLVSNNNSWWRAAGNGQFSSTAAFFNTTNYNNWENGFTHLNFDEWKSARGVDGASTWGSVDLSSVGDPTISVSPVITSNQSASGNTNSPFSYQILAANGPTSFSRVGGTLPVGISLNTSTGLLSGTPSQSGTFTPSFTATNSSGTSPAVAITLATSPLPLPVISPAQSTTVISGAAFSYQILASGSPTSYALSSGTLPSGISLNSSTGLLSGSTLQTGTFTPFFSATNSTGTGSATSISIQINLPPAAPLIVYDGFAGSTVNNGGTGWLSFSTWAGTIVFGNNLTFGNLLTTGNSLVNTDQFGGPSREFPTINTGTIWFSWLQSNNAATTRAASVYFMNGGSLKFGIGQNKDEANTNFRIYNAARTSVATTAISTDGTHLVAGSLNLATGALTLYINPTGLGVGGTPSSAATATVNLGAMELGQFGLGTGDSNFIFDELRVGTSWAEVSPTSGPLLTPPVVTANQAASGTVNASLTFAVLASNTPTSYALIGDLPAGITLNTSTGELSGTPSASGTFTPSFTATNAGGTSPAVALTITIAAAAPPAPTAPSSLSATANSSTQITLTWTDNAANETGFRIEYSADGSTGWSQIATTADNTTSFADTGLTASTTYFYRVRATNATGDSAYTSVANAATLAAGGGTLITIEAEDYDTGGQDVAYNDTNASNYGGAYRPNEGVDLEICSEGGFNIGWTSAGEWTQYTVTVSASGNYDISFRVSSQNGGGPLRLSVDGVALSDDLSAPSTGGWQNWSNVIRTGVSLTAGQRVIRITSAGGNYNLNRFTLAATAMPAPAAPSLLSATANSSTQITLTWTDNATNETGFKIERSADGSTGWSQIATPAANATTFADTGLATGTAYFYRVRATNATGDSAYTSVANATTQGTIDVTNGLVARLAFDETSGTTAADSTGNGRTGTLQTGASFAVGKINNGVSLNGSSGYVAMPVVFNPATQTDFTVSTWVRLASANAGAPTILQQEDGSGPGRTWLYRNTSGQLASFLGFAETTSSSTLLTGIWYHVALVKTGSSLQLYVNGAANGSPTTRTMESCIGAMRIGTHKSTTNQYWDGQIDEVRFYNRALSGSELATVAAWSPSAATGFQTFRTTYGLATDGSQDLLTPAGDGVANLLKYAFNMLGTGTGQAAALDTPNASILAANGSAGLPFVDVDGTGKLQITYIRRKISSNPGVTYAVEFSDALATWAVNGFATEGTPTSINATFERVTVTDNAPVSAKRFARVLVTIP